MESQTCLYKELLMDSSDTHIAPAVPPSTLKEAPPITTSNPADTASPTDTTPPEDITPDHNPTSTSTKSPSSPSLKAELSGEEWLAAQTQKVFDGVAALAASELQATSDEFQLLEQVNRVASAKYAELADTVDSLESVSKELIEQREF